MNDPPQMREQQEATQSRIAAIFRQEREKLVRLVRWKFEEFSNSDAEDLVQDVMHSILRRGDMVRQIEDLAGYLYRSLANRIIDQKRKPARELPLEVPDNEEDGMLRLAFEPVSENLNPEQHSMQRQLHERLQAALAKLSPLDRAIWIETEIHGRSFKELSEEWQEPIGTLLSRKSRSGKRLRTMLCAERRD